MGQAWFTRRRAPPATRSVACADGEHAQSFASKLLERGPFAGSEVEGAFQLSKAAHDTPIKGCVREGGATAKVVHDERVKNMMVIVRGEVPGRLDFAFRGIVHEDSTGRNYANLSQAMRFKLVPLSNVFSRRLRGASGVMVHEGFQAAYVEEVRDNVLGKAKDKRVKHHFTGFGAGGVMATFAAMDLKAAGFEVASVVTFGSLPFANSELSKLYAELGLASVTARFVNRADFWARVNHFGGRLFPFQHAVPETPETLLGGTSLLGADKSHDLTGKHVMSYQCTLQDAKEGRPAMSPVLSLAREHEGTINFGLSQVQKILPDIWHAAFSGKASSPGTSGADVKQTIKAEAKATMKHMDLCKQQWALDTLVASLRVREDNSRILPAWPPDNMPDWALTFLHEHETVSVQCLESPDRESSPLFRPALLQYLSAADRFLKLVQKCGAPASHQKQVHATLENKISNLVRGLGLGWFLSDQAALLLELANLPLVRSVLREKPGPMQRILLENDNSQTWITMASEWSTPCRKFSLEGLSSAEDLRDEDVKEILAQMMADSCSATGLHLDMPRCQRPGLGNEFLQETACAQSGLWANFESKKQELGHNLLRSKKLTQLHLNLEGSDVSEQAVQTLLDFLPRNMRELTMNFTFDESFTGEILTKLADCFPEGLKKLDLNFRWNLKFDDASFKVFVVKLPQGLESLSLDFSRNENFTDESLKELADHIDRLPRSAKVEVWIRGEVCDSADSLRALTSTRASD